MDGIDQISVADYVAHCLVDCGVTHVFGGHGGAVVPLIDAICRHPKLTWILTRIEVSASMAAAAYAKVSGTLGCCVGTSGPGASHLTTGLIDAESDRVPVLCLSGLKKREGLGCSDFQDINQTELFSAAGISYSQNVMHENGLVPILRDAIATALTNQVCSHLAIPVDVQQAIIKSPPCLSKCSAGGDLSRQCSPAASDIQNVARYLVELRSQKDALLFAIGEHAVGKAAQNVLSIAEALGVPVVTTLDAKGSVREDHPQVLGVFGIFGRPGMEASAKLVTTASTIVSFGVDDHTQLIFLNKSGSQTAHLVQINHAALHDLRFKTAHLLAGDIACIAERLLDEICLMRASAGEGLRAHAISENEVTTIDLDTSPQNDLIDEAQPGKITREITWGSTSTLNRFAAEAAHQRPCTYQVPKDEIKAGSCHPGLVMSRLSNILQEGAIVSIDAGESSLWASLCLCLKRNDQRAITSMRLGTQGYSVYGAIGSAAFNPNVPIVGITDDRSFQFAMNELPTLRQMQATVVFIIFSTGQTLHGNHIPTPDFCKVAKAHGGQGIRLDESDTNVIDQSLQNALRNTGITLVEVVRDVAVEPLKTRPNIVSEITQSSISKKHAWVLE